MHVVASVIPPYVRYVARFGVLPTVLTIIFRGGDYKVSLRGATDTMRSHTMQAHSYCAVELCSYANRRNAMWRNT